MRILAGINSSTKEQQAGKNEHLRIFKASLASSTSAVEKEAGIKNSIEEVDRTSLFAPSTAVKKETYQRVLRLSSARKGDPKRVAAIATGLAPEGEVVVFDFDGSEPIKSHKSIKLQKGDEAGDVDIIDSTGDGEYIVAYCTDHEVYLYDASNKTTKTAPNPRRLYEMPFPDVFENSKARPTFRALRFLEPHLLLLLANIPGRKGAELYVLRTTAGIGQIILRKRLHSACKAGTSLDVSNLSGQSRGEAQFVIAVAGIDSSIEVLTLEYRPSKGLSKFKQYSILRNVHPLQLTKIAFSTFHPPSHPVNAETLPQYLKLASVSLGNTVVVHTFPLVPIPFRSRTPRYVLQAPSQGLMMTFGVISSLIVVLLSAILFQAFLEIRGGSPAYLGATQWLSPTWQNRIARPYMFEKPATDGLRQLVEIAGGREKAVMIRMPESGALSVDVHSQEEAVQEETARRWEDLQEHEQSWWKQKLTDAGHWAAEEGDTIFKGVFFSEIAGMVGQAVAGQ